jgi:lipopolysaccharide export system protein LptA
MQVLTKPNRTICIGNVVFRRGPTLVCCQRFEGFANDQWDLERGVCTEDVRARRGEELMWSDKADYTAASGELVLTGRPLLRRGQSLIEGERVIAHVREEQAKIDKPRGRVVSETEGASPRQAPPPKASEGPLPQACPLPASSKR